MGVVAGWDGRNVSSACEDIILSLNKPLISNPGLHCKAHGFVPSQVSSLTTVTSKTGSSAYR
jgi:hypothetical protein